MASGSKAKTRNSQSIRLAIAVLAIYGSLSTPASAQQASCSPQTVFVSVEDATGQPVTGLTSANFHAASGKRPITITKAEPAPVRRIVLLLDRSGSMFNDYMYRTSAFIVSNIAQRSPPEIELAFVTYANDFTVRQELTLKHDELLETVKQALADKSIAWGPSAMLDASIKSLDLLKPPGSGDVVMLVTDGGENKSSATWADVERHFAGYDVRLIAAVIAPLELTDYDRYYNTQKMSELKKLFSITGEVFWLGSGYSMKNSHPNNSEFHVSTNYREIPDVTDAILRNFAGSYRLQVSVPAEFTKPKDWKLEVTDGKSEKSAPFFVRYPSKLYACSATNARK